MTTLQPMGWTSEMVAQTYKVPREKQDQYALISHTRATKVSCYYSHPVTLISHLQPRPRPTGSLPKRSFQLNSKVKSSLSTILFVRMSRWNPLPRLNLCSRSGARLQRPRGMQVVSVMALPCAFSQHASMRRKKAWRF